MRLPLNWFEKRHIGDLVSRFRSAEPIQRLISEGLVAAFVDGVMATLTLAMILIYSPKLSGIVFAALALYALLRFALYRSLRQRQEEMIEAAAKEQTTFIETARAIQSIKIFGRESDREAVWQNRYAESISRSIRQGRFTIGFKTANDLIYGLENVLVIWLGARAIMGNELTIGMLYRLHGLQGAVPREGHQPDRDRHPVSACSIFISTASPTSRSRSGKRTGMRKASWRGRSGERWS